MKIRSLLTHSPTHTVIVVRIVAILAQISNEYLMLV